MSSFWPSGLEISDTQSPITILETAREEWETKSDGVLTLVLQQATSQEHNAMIVVHAKHIPSNRTATLFSVIHRLKAPYPATIQPMNEDLPNSLKREYYKPGIGEIGIPSLQGLQGRTITNAWVSDTPTEFRDKLAKAFNLSVTKTAILSLAATDSSNIADEPEQQTEGQAPEE